MTDNNELIQLLKRRLSNKLFSGSPTIEESGKRFEDASANAGGVGMACFSSSREQEAAFQKAWKREALTAGPYIYALETELLKSLTPLPSPPISGEAVAWVNPQEMRLWKTSKNRPVTLRQWQDGYCTEPLFASPLTNEPIGVTAREEWEAAQHALASLEACSFYSTLGMTAGSLALTVRKVLNRLPAAKEPPINGEPQ